MPSHQAEAPPYYNPTATEEALRESEERYHAMFQYLNSGVAVYRAVGNGEDFVFKDFNEAAERIGRVQKREVLGKRLLEVFPDMDRCGLFSALQRVYRTGRPEHLPPVFYRDEIREGWREDFVYRLPSGDVVAICDDITDRKRAEIALTESEERYRGVVESQTEFITRFTPDFRVTFVNEAFARFFGLDREDIIGMRFRPDIPPEDREALGRHFAALTRERPVGTIEHRIVIPGGQVRWQKWVDRAIFDAAGELVEFQSVGRDTTDRRLAEEALRESEEKYRNVVERANDGITILQDRKLRFVNRRYALLWGGTVEEMVGRDLTDFIHPDEREKVLKRYHQRLGGEKVASVYDTVLLHRDGSPFPAELNSGLISYHGRPAHLVFIRDITERGRAEKALRESQDRYRKIVEGTNAGVWVIADDNSTIYANDQMARMLGREAPGMLGRPVTDFIFPADLPRCEAMLGDLKTGAIQEAEVRLRRRDGSSAWMHLTAGPYYDIDGRHVGCTGVFSDVTERKRAMEELRESEERYRTLIETANEAIVIAQDGILKFVNPRAVEILQATPEKIASVPFTDFIHPEDRATVLERYSRRVAGEDIPADYDFRFVGDQGLVTWVHLSAVRITWNGRPATLNFLIDVNERRKMEQEIRESEEMFRNPVERSPVGVFLIQDGLAKYINPKLAEMAGYSREEMLNRPFDLSIHPDDVDRVKAEVDRLLRGETTSAHIEYRGRGKDGSVGMVEAYGSSMLVEGRPAVYGTIVDVTDRKELENRIRESLQEKEVLLKEIHHRVKNNMQVISSLLSVQAQNIRDPEVRGLFNESQNRIRSIALVHELLYRSDNLDQIEYGAYLKKMFLPLFESYSIDQRKVSMAIDAKDVMITIEKAVPCSLIVNELISNSLKHAFPGDRRGEIRIGFRLDAEGGRYLLDYRDDGVGVPPGFDVKAATTLGMRLVHGLTRQLQGTVEHLPGEGVHFSIAFPAKKSQGGPGVVP